MMNSNLFMVLTIVTALFIILMQQQSVNALDNITVLDYSGDVTIIQFPNGTTHNLNVSEYSECVANSVMNEGIPKYLTEGADEDELLTNNELGIAEAMDECVGRQP